MENEKPNYYAIIPASVRYDKDLRANEKLMYGEITALSSKYGECTASNNYFARLYEVQPSAISKWIKDLQDKNYIEVEYLRNGKEIEKRIIKITGIHKCDYVFTNEEEGYSQKRKENNTSINNTSIKNINNKLFIKKFFVKPTLEEVKDYCLERNNSIDPESFIDFYESKGWMIGKSKMKDWKAAIRNWEHKNKPQKSKQQQIIDELRKKYEEEERNEQEGNSSINGTN